MACINGVFHELHRMSLNGSSDLVALTKRHVLDYLKQNYWG